MARKQKVLLAERVVICRPHRLGNGNLFIEAEFLDNIHLIGLSLEIEPSGAKIVKATGECTNIPYKNLCPIVLPKVKKMKGLVIQRGILKEVSGILGGPKGCVNLRNLTLEAIDLAASILIAYKAGITSFSPNFGGLSEEAHHEMLRNYLKGTCIAFPKD